MWNWKLLCMGRSCQNRMLGSASASGGAPKCAVCNHHHEQGSKCSICGHTGKSRVFQLLRNRPLMNVFSVRGFDCLTRSPSISHLDRNLWSFTKILRGRIFPNVMPELPDDPNARHLIAFVGDAPIATVRWRVAVENHVHFVEIEMLGVLVDKRQRGYGKQLLAHVVEDISTRLAELQASTQAIVAHIPDHDATAALKLFEAAAFQLDAERHVRQGVSCFRMFMLAPT